MKITEKEIRARKEIKKEAAVTLKELAKSNLPNVLRNALRDANAAAKQKHGMEDCPHYDFMTLIESKKDGKFWRNVFHSDKDYEIALSGFRKKPTDGGVWVVAVFKDGDTLEAETEVIEKGSPAK
jgi:hypothetical protein